MTVRPLAEVEIKHPILSPLKDPAVPDLFALIPFDLYTKSGPRWRDDDGTLDPLKYNPLIKSTGH